MVRVRVQSGCICIPTVYKEWISSAARVGVDEGVIRGVYDACLVLFRFSRGLTSYQPSAQCHLWGSFSVGTGKFTDSNGVGYTDVDSMPYSACCMLWIACGGFCCWDCFHAGGNNSHSGSILESNVAPYLTLVLDDTPVPDDTVLSRRGGPWGWTMRKSYDTSCVAMWAWWKVNYWECDGTVWVYWCRWYLLRQRMQMKLWIYIGWEWWHPLDGIADCRGSTQLNFYHLTCKWLCIKFPTE